MEKATLGFRIYIIWQILKRFAGTFRRAQTLKLGGVLGSLNFDEIIYSFYKMIMKEEES